MGERFVKVGRFGTRNLYLGPNGRTGMRFGEAREAFKRVRDLRAQIDAEVAYSMATGFGDHAKIARLDADLAALTA
jgi:hypothetical protein